jgi:hypothetical protein
VGGAPGYALLLGCIPQVGLSSAIHLGVVEHYLFPIQPDGAGLNGIPATAFIEPAYSTARKDESKEGDRCDRNPSRRFGREGSKP